MTFVELLVHLLPPNDYTCVILTNFVLSLCPFLVLLSEVGFHSLVLSNGVCELVFDVFSLNLFGVVALTSRLEAFDFVAQAEC